MCVHRNDNKNVNKALFVVVFNFVSRRLLLTANLLFFEDFLASFVDKSNENGMKKETDQVCIWYE